MGKQEQAGICVFAYNNPELDYIKFATIVSQYVKRNMQNNKVCLITDDGTVNWMEQSIDKQTIDECFDYIITSDIEHESNPRVHHDSPWTEFNSQFKNSNKHKVFEYTPFEKTLLIDVDYLIMNNFYDYLFDTDISIGLHKNAEYIGGELPYFSEMLLNSSGIHHWWSTVVYFDQSQESKLFFDIWSHVRDNYEYYSLLYQFPKYLYRTDFCVSIACHLMNGMNSFDFIHDFKGVPMINMDQKDDIVKFNKSNDVIFLKHNRVEQWKNILVRHTNDNLHVMNKRSLDRHSSQIAKHFEESPYV